MSGSGESSGVMIISISSKSIEIVYLTALKTSALWGGEKERIIRPPLLSTAR